jgi:DNA-binding beta-propeller fold protein YncE
MRVGSQQPERFGAGPRAGAAGVATCAFVAAAFAVGGARSMERFHIQAGTPLAVVEQLADPESVVFDSVLSVYFVSNVNGSPGVKDGNGFITRITAEGRVENQTFIQGGRGGVELNAPMGSRVRGDTLWVLDVDVLRGFNTRTGAAVAAIDFAPSGALFLNDLALDPKGGFYVTDTGVRSDSGPDGKPLPPGPGRIYHVSPDGEVTVALETRKLAFPDGIDWDARGKRLVLGPFGGNSVQSWRPGERAPTDVAPGKGKFDGVEVAPDGTVLVTSWNDSSVAVLQGNRLVRRLSRLSMTPADVSLDARRGRVGIVSLEANRFELWAWPTR